MECVDCGADLGDYEGQGRPKLRCDECKATKRREDDIERRHHGGLFEHTEGAPRSCEDCGDPMPAYTGKGRPAAVCAGCKRIRRREIERQRYLRSKEITA